MTPSFCTVRPDVAPEPEAEPVTASEQLPGVDNSCCAQPEIEIAVYPEREEVAEKGGEGSPRRLG